MTLDLCIVTASNNPACLELNLMQSPMVKCGQVGVQVEYDAPSATIAYARGMAATTSQIIVFAHQDVYFPRGWEEQLACVLDDLETRDPDWAILACCGISVIGDFIGDVWSTSLGGRIGAPMGNPQPVQSVDELVIIMRRSAGLTWDTELPNFHMYGTDIVQSALASGQGAWVADLPVIHNDNFHTRLGSDFTASFRYMQRKWRAVLPIQTTVGKITRWGIALALSKREARKSIDYRKQLALDPLVDPRHYAAESGLE
ncbi:hypothetical protein BDE40_3284 [Litoreibacter halocynthiae]|uniref:Glycosyl transferase family 2 n=1 Tax=Litoreibacter halocynthiae TaxID=1242689 RepID=A0A4R7LEV7_9RHOB|nr:hypothetical protein [Litoreibacter halocynthiae]TDT73102.1 hypothetical protein BDE40_3284 [Litoreibacter halocynthiae]